MSTKSSLAYAETEKACVHLYYELIDDEVHLELESNGITVLDFVVPKEMVKDLTALLKPINREE